LPTYSLGDVVDRQMVKQCVPLFRIIAAARAELLQEARHTHRTEFPEQRGESGLSYLVERHFARSHVSSMPRNCARGFSIRKPFDSTKQSSFVAKNASTLPCSAQGEMKRVNTGNSHDNTLY